MAEHLTWMIGPVRITRVEERITGVPWAGLVPAGADHLEACRPWIDPYVSGSGNSLLLSVHSFVLETPETLIVVDTCVGSDEGAKLPGDPAFGDRLETVVHGFENVDVVVCTHLHFDHVGWNTVERDGQLVPTFPTARYLVTNEELAADRDAEDTASYERAIAPLAAAGCLDAVEPTHRIDPWVALEPTPGHTPGHVSVRITANDEVALILGDLVHTPLQFAFPEAPSNPDHDPAQATDTRRRIVREHGNEPTLLLGTHFAPPTAGHVEIDDDGNTRFV